MRRWQLPALALATTFAVPALAQAAPKGLKIKDGFDQGGFVYGSPLIFAAQDEDDFPDLDATWQWSVGGGYLFVPGGYFMASVGGAFEHTIYDFDIPGLDGSQIRFMGEGRLGAGADWFFAYGIIGAGLGLSILDVESEFGDDDDADPGGVFGIGGGAQFIVWQNLMVGAEIDADLAFFPDDDDTAFDDDYATYTVGFKALVGWYF